MANTSTNTVTRTRRRDAAATREALLHAGAVMFAESGFDGVRVDALARRAGVNKAMISYHFGGKRGLYRAVLRSAFEELQAGLGDVDQAKGAEARLAALIDVFARVATQRRPNFPAMLLREALGGGTELYESLPYVAEVARRIASIVEDGRRAGSFRRVDPVLTHLSLIGALAFFFATAPARRRAQADGKLPKGFARATPERYVAHLTEMTRRGLAAREEAK